VNSIERAKKEVEVLKTQKKESMKELKRLNEWVYTAQEEQKKLGTNIVSLSEKQALKMDYIADIEDWKIKKEGAEEAYKEIVLDAKLVSDETEVKTTNCEQKVEKAEKKLAKLKEDSKIAKEKLDSFVKEKNKKEKDLEIYINRIEKAYKKQFPDKSFKL
jgi:chromosome segregation ATPase